MQNIIIFCGHIGSGKDTSANYFIKNYGYSYSKMAGSTDRVGSLKRVVFEIFDLDINKVEDREYREQPHENLDNKTPRQALQYFGHETRTFLKDVWVNNTIRHIKSLGDKNFVLSDVRYINEYDAIKKMENENTKVTLVAIKNLKLNMDDEVYNDPSEKEIPKIQEFANYTIYNNYSISELYENLGELHEFINNNH